MQGVVYGTKTAEMVNDSLLTRFDFDAVFGTVLNRFCALAVLGRKLTVYGAGGQRRPFISFGDALQCLRLVIENPPKSGEYSVVNQFDEAYSVAEVAEKVKKAANRLGANVEVKHVENHRVEAEKVPYYNPVHEKLYKLGFRPGQTLEKELDVILTDLAKYKQRVAEKSDKILPNVQWKAE